MIYLRGYMMMLMARAAATGLHLSLVVRVNMAKNSAKLDALAHNRPSNGPRGNCETINGLPPLIWGQHRHRPLEAPI